MKSSFSARTSDLPHDALPPTHDNEELSFSPWTSDLQSDTLPPFENEKLSFSAWIPDLKTDALPLSPKWNVDGTWRQGLLILAFFTIVMYGESRGNSAKNPVAKYYRCHSQPGLQILKVTLYPLPKNEKLSFSAKTSDLQSDALPLPAPWKWQIVFFNQDFRFAKRCFSPSTHGKWKVTTGLYSVKNAENNALELCGHPPLDNISTAFQNLGCQSSNLKTTDPRGDLHVQSLEAAQWEGGVQKVNKILSVGLQPEWGHEVLHNVLSDLL